MIEWTRFKGSRRWAQASSGFGAAAVSSCRPAAGTAHAAAGRRDGTARDRARRSRGGVRRGKARGLLHRSPAPAPRPLRATPPRTCAREHLLFSCILMSYCRFASWNVGRARSPDMTLSPQHRYLHVWRSARRKRSALPGWLFFRCIFSAGCRVAPRARASECGIFCSAFAEKHGPGVSRR